MDIENIVQQLRNQLGRLDAAISALERGATPRGRPRKVSQPTGAKRGKGQRHMSATARAKIAAAQRARWAKQKGRATAVKASTTKKAAYAMKKSRRKAMSAAARKRLSELMKQRWAARKKTP